MILLLSLWPVQIKPVKLFHLMGTRPKASADPFLPEPSHAVRKLLDERLMLESFQLPRFSLTPLAIP